MMTTMQETTLSEGAHRDRRDPEAGPGRWTCVGARLDPFPENTPGSADALSASRDSHSVYRRLASLGKESPRLKVAGRARRRQGGATGIERRDHAAGAGMLRRWQLGAMRGRGLRGFDLGDGAVRWMAVSSLLAATPSLAAVASVAPTEVVAGAGAGVGVGSGATAVTQARTLLQELNLPAIWFLVACSVLIVWLVIDLYLRSARRELLPEATLATVRASFRRGDFQAAFDVCAARTGLFATAVLAALRHASEGKTASEDAAAGALEAGQSRLQTRIAYLSVIGVIAPMVGLTGTVLGMIDAFAAMGQPGAADPARLSGAIGHVLHATAGGLIVAIPAFVLHYVLRSRVAHAVRAVADEVQELFRGFPYASRAGVDFRGAECGVPRKLEPSQV